MTDYALRLGSGIGISLIWLWFTAPLFRIKRTNLIKWILILSFVALAFGRLGYMLIHSAYFHQNPAHILQIRRVGGIHGESALLGGLVGLGIWAGYRHKTNTTNVYTHKTHGVQSFAISYNHLLTLFTPAILCVVAGAWWACMNVGCAWGRAVNTSSTQSPWFLIQGPDLYHTVKFRYPVQLLGALWALITAVFGAICSRKKYGGALILLLYCLGGSALTLLRGDAVSTIAQLRIDTIENIGIALMLVGVWWWSYMNLRLTHFVTIRG